MTTKQSVIARAGVLLLAMICLAGSTLSFHSVAPKKSAYITVSAGSVDRRESIVSFDLPAELRGLSYGLREESARNARIVPVQLDAKRRATFVLPELRAGGSKTYRLVEVKATKQTIARAELSADQSQLHLNIAGRKALSFVVKPPSTIGPEIKPVFVRGGYIHPVYTPSGRIVTDDYPSDHYHHHGIWFAWTKTEFEGGHPDFWNVHDGTGRVEFEALDATWGGPVHAGFKSRQRYVALTGPAPKTALNEEWEVRLYNLGQGATGYFMFDLVATQRATSAPLILEEYRYGGMGFRGHRDWKDKSKISFLTSEGKTRADGNATRARWCHIGGPAEGHQVGVAILDHPANFRAPQPMRINPDDPFFNYAPSQMGKFEIKPGDEFVLRYRFVVSDGPPNTGEINRLWTELANPPQVTVAVK